MVKASKGQQYKQMMQLQDSNVTQEKTAGESEQKAVCQCYQIAFFPVSLVLLFDWYLN